MDEVMAPEWIKNTFDKNVWFFDGDELAIALQVKNNKTGKITWDIDRITVSCDDDGFRLCHAETGESYDAWEWWDVEYFIRINAQGPMTKEEMMATGALEA